MVYSRFVSFGGSGAHKHGRKQTQMGERCTNAIKVGGHALHGRGVRRVPNDVREKEKDGGGTARRL